MSSASAVLDANLASGVGPWHEIDEDDLLYCVVFGGEGQPHTNAPYCATMPYQRRMFYGDGTLAFAYNGLLARLGLTVSAARLESADAKYTARLFIGDRMRVRFESMEILPTDNQEDVGTIKTCLEVENQDGEVAMTLEVSLVLLSIPMGVPVA